MSWEVLIVSVPDDVRSTSEFQSGSLRPLGSKKEVLDVLLAAFPGVDISDPAWVSIVGQNHSLRFSMSENEPIEALVLTIHGVVEEVLRYIEHLCVVSGWRAVDSTTGEFLNLGDEV